MMTPAAIPGRLKMPNSIIIGRLHGVEGDEIVMGGGLRIKLAAGVTLPTVYLGTNVTVVAVSRDGVTFAESVKATPEGNRLGLG